jgi:NAD(P)-dependent dehydrogenase (short-subunit alcohol dehydrogenase family)
MPACSPRGAAAVVVHDAGVVPDGSGHDPSVADGVVAEIAASGGTAAAAYENLEEAGAGARLVDLAVARFGRLDALIHNAESGMVISAAGGRFFRRPVGSWSDARSWT